jgi:hypothetical protein
MPLSLDHIAPMSAQTCLKRSCVQVTIGDDKEDYDACGSPPSSNNVTGSTPHSASVDVAPKRASRCCYW